MTYVSGAPLSPTERAEFAAEGKRSAATKIARERACTSAERYTRHTPLERIAARRITQRILGELDEPSESR